MKPITEHKAILAWANSRGAIPGRVRGTEDGTAAVLRFIIPGATNVNKNLEEISWDHFFTNFDLLGLAFVFQDTTSSGEKSSQNEILQLEPQPTEQSLWH